ncbi:MAG: hypothetical protein DCC47_16030 [Acidobacteria bacterium]|nr:MAG: hypothetical protein DCC47_16030 [Acidobacteriota bacterium]
MRHGRPPVPYDPVAERYVLAAAIAGPDLTPGDVDPGDFYVPAHARIAAAVRLLDAAGEPTVRRCAWRTVHGRTVLGCELPGLDRALAAVGSPDVAGDLDVAASIMACDPGGPYTVGGRLAGGPRYHADRVADLARRRRRMAELEAERERLIEGVAG